MWRQSRSVRGWNSSSVHIYCNGPCQCDLRNGFGETPKHLLSTLVLSLGLPVLTSCAQTWLHGRNTTCECLQKVGSRQYNKSRRRLELRICSGELADLWATVSGCQYIATRILFFTTYDSTAHGSTRNKCMGQFEANGKSGD